MGFFSRFKKKNTIAEASSSELDNSKISVKKIGLAFSDGSTKSRLEYEDPEGFNFETITNAYNTDAYIRQAIDKHVDFAFKAGWDLVGSNADAVQYVNNRFYALELAMGVPMDVFLKEAYHNYLLYSNCFILKSFANRSYKYPGNLKVNPGMYPQTINGYQCLPVDSITIARDAYGNVIKYKQEISGSTVSKLEMDPSLIIHMYSNKPTGKGFGFPDVWETLEDIKILRQLEELMIKSVYKNVFPLHVYTVGLNADGQRCKEGEIDEVKEELGDLQLDGGLVIPERHKIEIIGAEGKVLALQDYLTYFENRAFTGLKVSPTIMGRSDTSNKSTASNLDQIFKDTIKSNQSNFSSFVTKFIINELLAEGGFNFILDPSYRVSFKFREIDLDLQIAYENHAIQMLMQNGLTYPEFRKRIGYDPLDSYDLLYFNVIKANSDEKTAEQKTQAAQRSGQNKDKPTNQHGTKNSPKIKKEELKLRYLKLLSYTINQNKKDKTSFKSIYRSFRQEWEENFENTNIDIISSMIEKNIFNEDEIEFSKFKSYIELLT